jgi:transposase
MRRNKYIKLDNKEELELYKFIESEGRAREKRRAMAILMSNDKKSVKEISNKFKMNTDTVYDWLNNYSKDGLKGLVDKPILGRPKKLKKEHNEEIKEVLKKIC